LPWRLPPCSRPPARPSRAGPRQAHQVDWIVAAIELLNTEAGSSPPRRHIAAAELQGQVNHLALELDQFDPRARLGDSAPPEVLREYTPDFPLSLTGLLHKVAALENRPGYREVRQLASLWTIPDQRRDPWFKDRVAHVRREAAGELGRLRRNTIEHLADRPPLSELERQALQKVIDQLSTPDANKALQRAAVSSGRRRDKRKPS
jgi:hypothetical protein